MMLFKDTDYIEEFKKIKHDGKFFEVLENMKNEEQAVNFLAKIDKRISHFVNHLQRKHPNDKRIKRFHKLKNRKIIEPELIKDTSSYTINKGEILAFCVRLKSDHTKFHDEDILDFVIIHELAHVISKSIGHTQEWLSNFKFLLHSLAESNIYIPIDYSKKNDNYCGIVVTNNPYFN